MRMKKLLFMLMAVFMFSACGDEKEEVTPEKPKATLEKMEAMEVITTMLEAPLDKVLEAYPGFRMYKDEDYGIYYYFELHNHTMLEGVELWPSENIIKTVTLEAYEDGIHDEDDFLREYFEKRGFTLEKEEPQYYQFYMVNAKLSIRLRISEGHIEATKM